MVTIYYSNARSQQLTVLDKLRVGTWVHATDVTSDDIDWLAKECNLDLDLLSDALDIYESPRIERDGKAVYVYTRYCFPESAEIATQPLLVVHTGTHLITVMRNHNAVLDRLLGSGEIITTQRTKTFLQILTAVNYSYEKYIYKVSKQILAIRSQMRKIEIKNEDFVEFIDLEENLNESLSALQAQSVVLRTLLAGRYLQLYEDDRDLIEDLSLGTAELIELTVSRLKTISNTREAYATIMANTLNKTFKKLTSISIFMAIPTIAGGLYGMNLALPMANHPNAFWYVVLAVAVMTAAAVWLFNKRKWL